MQGIALRTWGCKQEVTTFAVSRSGNKIATVDGVGTLKVSSRLVSRPWGVCTQAKLRRARSRLYRR